MNEAVILALELSTPRGHVAVVRSGSVLFEAEFVSERSHNSMLYAPLGEALEAAGDALALIVAGTGPGSYTGVRISIAAAHGVALSRNVPVIGLPSIAALDDSPRHAVVGDARRGKYYHAVIEEGRILGGVPLGNEEETRAWIASSGVHVFTSDDKEPLAGVGIICRRPCAIRLAQSAAALGEEAVWTLAEKDVEPLYVQEAFITKAKPKG